VAHLPSKTRKLTLSYLLIFINWLPLFLFPLLYKLQGGLKSDVASLYYMSAPSLASELSTQQHQMSSQLLRKIPLNLAKVNEGSEHVDFTKVTFGEANILFAYRHLSRNAF
jgi:hypothetical protein